MRRLFVILGLIASVFSVILSVTPLSKIGYIPAVVALIFGAIAFYFSKQKQYPIKSIQLIFLLTIISLTITTYKAVFTIVEVGNMEGLELKEKESEEKAIEELEGLDLENHDLKNNEDSELESLDIIE